MSKIKKYIGKIINIWILFSIALCIDDLQKIVVIFIVIPVLTFGLKFGKRDLKNKASVFPSWGVRCLKKKKIDINYGNDSTCISTTELKYILGINMKNRLHVIKLYYTCLYMYLLW